MDPIFIQHVHCTGAVLVIVNHVSRASKESKKGEGYFIRRTNRQRVDAQFLQRGPNQAAARLGVQFINTAACSGKIFDTVRLSRSLALKTWVVQLMELRWGPSRQSHAAVSHYRRSKEAHNAANLEEGRASRLAGESNSMTSPASSTATLS
jgi:hypothetical protein